MAKQSKGLGRGFESLIPTDVSQKFNEDSHNSKQVLIEDIKPNPQQPRSSFDQQSHEELVASVKIHGVMQPIVITKDNSGYTIVAGERRWRAAKEAGLKWIPAIVRSLDEQKKLEMALIENIQRENLNPLELADSFVKLSQQFALTQAQIAKQVGKAEKTVANIVRLVDLPQPAKDALATHRISEGHARQILALKQDPKKQQELLDYILKYNWSVRQAEQFVSAYKKGAKTAKEAKKSTIAETKETKAIGKKLNTKVAIKRTAKGGQILINFKDDKDLNRITKKLS